ncbi:MAG: hypothetical protein DME87_11990 [Verrucomicrobia bacterium]|nr:MAG: hypothetical protein DME87_11990 [Verrucomicrobiota bacterium]
MVVPVSAAEKPGSISGYVRSSVGVPQMGALVEVLGSAARTLKVFTDENGFYSAVGLLPGNYNVRVSAPSFLPAERERVGLRAGASVIVNLTLNTLFQAMQLAPMRGPADEDDWKWVLRSTANRPILRVLEDGSPAVISQSEQGNHELKGTLSFVAGSPSEGFGSASDVSTGFSVERSIFSTGTVAVRGNVGYGSGSPAAVLRASYIHKMDNGSQPQVTFTMRRLAAPDINLHSAALQALSLTTSDDINLGDILELRFGSELQTIQFMGRVTAFRPFGSADLHLSPNTVLEYRYATSEPDSRMDKGFDTAPADLSESGPHVSIAGFSPSLERAHHHELSISRRVGKNNLQMAVYADRVIDPALTGVGDFLADNGEVLPDLYSGTFTYRGRELDTRGLRIVLQRKLSSDVTATLDYGYGGVLDLAKDDVMLRDARESILIRDRHTLAAKVSGTVPGAGTRWVASYRWISGQALTPVDMFNASAGQSDPYLNIFFRQPIPGTSFLPGHMDALIDVRNLLAQGYVPLIGQDKHTVYLVQSARAVRGGVAFTF